ncbi:MAG: DUF2185 domain-containing protein, partial [Planctomycetes bacterium]|nr:DUF2185 domain-containing protein [Planctomycetota bacterium]
MSSTPKKFKLDASEIKQMVPNMGGALATDKITVEGNKVDYMFRNKTEREGDTGWIFYGGGETQEYIDNPDNTSIYNINTIVNYDPEIIPFITYPPGTEIERNQDGQLELVTQNVPQPPVVFLAPAETGEFRVSKNWSFNIPSRMLRRV